MVADLGNPRRCDGITIRIVLLAPLYDEAVKKRHSPFLRLKFIESMIFPGSLDLEKIEKILPKIGEGSRI